MGFGKRRAKGVHNHDGYHRMRSESKTQPHEIWQSTVPKWEKDFCATVGLIPWWKILDTKKYIHLHEKIIKWNDSASEEAFKLAKNRFWAHMNGFTSEIISPDPDIYIDEVDWNTEIDPELFLDLERRPEPNNYSNDDGKVETNNIELGIDKIRPTGWGDEDEEEEEFKVGTSIPSWKWNSGDDGKHGWEDDYDYNGWNNSNYFTRNAADREHNSTWGMKSLKKDGSGWHNNNNSGHQRSRFSGNDYHQQRSNGCRGRRRWWNCAPVNNHSGSGRGGNHAWGWEKQVW